MYAGYFSLSWQYSSLGDSMRKPHPQCPIEVLKYGKVQSIDFLLTKPIEEIDLHVVSGNFTNNHQWAQWKIYF